MNPQGATFFVICAVALVVLPRTWLALPIFLGTFCMTQGQALDIGGANFYLLRLLLVVGLLRVLLRREVRLSKLYPIEWAVLAWGLVALAVCALRKDAADAFKYNAGMVMDASCVYLIFRAACRSPEEVKRCCYLLAVVLALSAIPTMLERRSGTNPFAIFGGVSETSAERDGKVRASGAFQTYITCGTAAATSVPLFVLLVRSFRAAGAVGLLSAAVVVYCSNSSGPIMSLGAALFALWMWPRRHLLPALKVGVIVTLALLEVVMKSHVWYLMAKIDITSGNNGYHRAELITQAFNHLSEWWLAGTNYTRHWMVTGVTWSPDHCDITDYYIKMGVLGGLPLMLAFLGVVWGGFRSARRALVGAERAAQAGNGTDDGFLVWCLGAALFTHAVTFISVSYFDQTAVLFWTSVALLASMDHYYGAKKPADEPHDGIQDENPEGGDGDREPAPDLGEMAVAS